MFLFAILVASTSASPELAPEAEVPPVSEVPATSEDATTTQEDAPPPAAHPGPPAPDAEPETFQDQLSMAKRYYYQGRRNEARGLLEQIQLAYLVNESAMPWELAAEAMVFLGEVLYADDIARAHVAWRQVLETDPDYPRLSPFEHTPEVAGEFERLRSIVRDEIAARPVPVPPPVPVWSVLPLGLPQFIQRHPARGFAFGAVQIGLGVTSLAMIPELNRVNVSEEPHPLGLSEDEVARWVNTRRYAIQWPATVGFYAVWAGSWLDARRQWREDHAVTTTLHWSSTPEGTTTVGVAGRF